MQLAEASANTSLQKSGKFSSFVSMTFNMAYYSIFRSSAETQGEIFLTNSTAETLSKFWNIADHNPYIRFFFKKMIPKVDIKKVIYAPKLLQPLTIEDLAHDVLKTNNEVIPKYQLHLKDYSKE